MVVRPIRNRASRHVPQFKYVGQGRPHETHWHLKRLSPSSSLITMTTIILWHRYISVAVEGHGRPRPSDLR